jgi:hypothetical protein
MYDIIRLTYNIVCWHATSYVHTMSYTIWTDDIVCHIRTTSYVHFWHTTLHTICGGDNIRCRMCDIRCRMLTYDIVRDIRCRTYNVVRLYPVYSTYDIAHTMYNTMSYVCTYDIVYTYDIVGGKNPDGRLKFQLKLTWLPFAIGAIFKKTQSHCKMCAGIPRAARRPTYAVNSVNLVFTEIWTLIHAS